MNLKLFIPLFCLLFTFCKKEDPISPPEDTSTGQAPQLTITSPANNSHYNPSDNIPITATITDDKEIFTLIVDVKNLGDNSVVHIINNHIHLTTYNLSTSYSTAATGDYQIIITVNDLDGNISTSTMNFSIL